MKLNVIILSYSIDEEVYQMSQENYDIHYNL